MRSFDGLRFAGLLLWGCTPAPKSDEGGETADTGSVETGVDTETGETATEESDTGHETEETGEPLAGQVTVEGVYRGRGYSLACAGGDAEEVFSRVVSDALGNLAGSVSCGAAPAPHDRFDLALVDAAPGAWTAPDEGNSFAYTSDEGGLSYTVDGVPAAAWLLRIASLDWVDPRTVQLVGEASGTWVAEDGALVGDVSAVFDLLIPCANCP
jgi:hypothetical protein